MRPPQKTLQRFNDLLVSLENRERKGWEMELVYFRETEVTLEYKSVEVKQESSDVSENTGCFDRTVEVPAVVQTTLIRLNHHQTDCRPLGSHDRTEEIKCRVVFVLELRVRLVMTVSQ